MHNEHIKINTVWSQQVESKCIKHNCGTPLLLPLSWEKGHSQNHSHKWVCDNLVSIPCLLLESWNQQGIETRSSQTHLGGNEGQCSWKYKTWRWGGKNLHILMASYWNRFHISPLLWNQWSFLSLLGKAAEMEWTRFISAPSEKCKVICGVVLSGMVISGSLDLQTLTREGHVRQWPISG